MRRESDGATAQRGNPLALLSRRQKMGWAALIMGMSVLLSRFMGLIRDKIISLCSAMSLSVISVEMKPGAIAFTVMWAEPTSFAMLRVKPISPAFEAE